MSNPLDNWFHATVAAFMTWLLSIHFFGVILVNITSILLPGIVSIIGGLITGFLSKILNKYFIDQAKDTLIKQQNQQILNLQRELQATKK